jgi:hypothetical protein
MTFPLLFNSYPSDTEKPARSSKIVDEHEETHAAQQAESEEVFGHHEQPVFDKIHFKVSWPSI